MRVAYAVSFEFATRAPQTHRGTVLGSSGPTCVARAAREAQRALRPVNWTSLAVVLLERVQDDGTPAELDEPATDENDEPDEAPAATGVQTP